MTQTILLADDSVTIQKVVELTFLDEDYRVVAIGNGSDAIERLGEVAPDLVLADVHMPGADGYEVCAAARERLPGVPVVLLVGTFEVFDAARAKEVQAADHLKKPFDSQDLLRRVKSLLAGVSEAPAPLADYAGAEVTPPEDTESGEYELPEGDSWSFEPVGEPEGPVVAPEPEAAAMAPPAVDAEAEPTGWSEEETPEFESVESPPVLAEAELEATPVAAEADELRPDTSPAFVPQDVRAADPTNGTGRELTDDEVDRIARRVVEIAAEKVVRDIAWEVVPDLAELLLKARIRELEASVE